MPSKKRKYNARFPAGRIKKIMQTDEDVGKVAQAVPIVISPRTIELFVDALVKKALQVTLSRNAKTLSPSHLKQCILAEARFDFLRDLVKNIPDVSIAEEMSGDSSPIASRFPDIPPRQIVREDSSSSSSGEVRVSPAPSTICPSREHLKRTDNEIPNKMKLDLPSPSTSMKSEPCSPRTPIKIEAGIPSTSVNVPIPVDSKMSPLLEKIKHKIMSQTKNEPNDTAIDLSKKEVRTANFYQETLVDETHSASVIKVNPTYASQPSTSYSNFTPVLPLRKVSVPDVATRGFQHFYPPNDTPRTPISPVINIDFSNRTRPVIKVLDETSAATAAPLPKSERTKVSRQNSRTKMEVKKVEPKPAIPVDIDSLNSGNLQIDEDYDT